MEDNIKIKGATKSSQPDAGGAVLREYPVLGIVKNNVDPIRAGRIQVYISDLGSDDPDDAESWVTVSFLSPFFGFVQPTAPDEGYGDYTTNPSSYGMWFSPPDIGTTVICIFVNGDPTYGYYIGAVPETETLQMVPAIGSSENIIPNTEGESQGYGGATRLPVTNLNTNSSKVSDSSDFLDQPRPIHSYTAMIMSQQGLIRDPIRGPISSSASRESPSRVGWGVSTPGRPIYQGGYTDADIVEAAEQDGNDDGLVVAARQGGHSIVMDDGDLIGQDQLIRIRSAAGHQILMSDDGQTLFIIHSNGQSYIELGKEGTIDLYCTNSFNVRTQGDINFHADRDININAKKKLNIKAEDINIESEKTTNHKIGTTYHVYTKGTYTHKVDGPMSMASGGEASYASSGICYINGSKVNLNTGSTSTTPETVPSIPIVAHTDTLFDTDKGYAAAPGKLQSITSRAPAHAPWANANQGVDVETSNSADSELPAAPSGPVQSANEQAAGADTSTVPSAATTATVPPVTSASGSVDPNTTGSMVAAVAQSAATGPAATAVSQGAGVVASATGPIAAVGQLAQTPAQLENAGVLKPGASALVNGLVKGGTPLKDALTPNLFTGKPGAENLTAFIQNPVAQVQAQVTNFQQAQTALTNAGVMTGRESPVATAGIIMAGATAGVGSTLSTIKNLTSTNNINAVGGVINAAANVAGALGANTKGLRAASSAVTSAMKIGNLSAGLAQTVSGGLGSISSATQALNQLQGISNVLQQASRGPAAAAFGAILGSFKPLKVGIPQNLFSIARSALQTADAIQNGNPLKAATSALSTLGLATGKSQVASALSGTLNAVSKLGDVTNPAQALNAFTSVAKNLQSVGAATGNKLFAQTAKNVAGVLSSTNQILNAGLAISSGSGGIAGTLNATASIIGNANKIASLVGSGSILASGLNALPGGQKSVSSVVSKTALGVAAAIPATAALGSLVNNSFAAATNGISLQNSLKGSAEAVQGGTSSLINQISNGATTAVNAVTSGFGEVAAGVTGALDKLKSGASTLKGLATDGLPAGAASQVTAAMSSLASSGSNPIKLPTVGEGTNDRSAVDAQINNLLGNPIIPKPNFTGKIADAAKAKLQEAKQKLDQTSALNNEVADLASQVRKAQDIFEGAVQSLPAGDPQINQSQQQLMDLVAKLQAKSQQLKDL